MEEAGPGLMSNEAQVGPEGLSILAEHCMAVPHPTREASSISGCCRHMRGRVCTAPREREKTSPEGIAIPAALI